MAQRESDSHSDTERRRALPAEMYIATALPLSPFAMGAVFAAALAALYLGGRVLLGSVWWRPDPTIGFSLTGSARLGIVLCLLLGYVPAVARANALAIFRDRQSVGAEDPEVDLREDEGPALRVDTRELARARRYGVAGVAAGLALHVATNRVRDAPFPSGPALFSELFLTGLGLLLFWLIGRGMAFTLHHSDDRSGRNLRAVEIDLGNLRPIFLIGRSALRSSLMWLVGLSISMLIWTSPDFSDNVLWVFAPTYAAVVAVSLSALLVPLRHVRRALRVAKQRELERVDRTLAEVRDAALGGEERSQERLAGVLAYRQHVSALPEWPFEPGVRSRLWLYGLIPLGSWVAGALVERGLGWLLD